MAHFAEIVDGVVQRVIVAADKEWCENALGGTWVQTSYNTHGGVHTNGGEPLRKNYAGIGYTYDAARDAFIPPKPFDSWLLNEDTCSWDAPIPMPTGEGRFRWDETVQQWVELADDPCGLLDRSIP